MDNRVKSIRIFTTGLVLGAILPLALGHILAEHNPKDKEILFNQPRQEINANKFKVTQVLPDNSALAMYENDFTKENTSLESGAIVRIKNKGETFYDDQIITLPQGKHFRQIGTYQYVAIDGKMKTVPIISIFDK